MAAPEQLPVSSNSVQIAIVPLKSEKPRQPPRNPTTMVSVGQGWTYQKRRRKKGDTPFLVLHDLMSSLSMGTPSAELYKDLDLALTAFQTEIRNDMRKLEHKAKAAVQHTSSRPRGLPPRKR